MCVNSDLQAIGSSHVVYLHDAHLSYTPVMVDTTCTTSIPSIQVSPKFQSCPSMFLLSSDEIKVIPSVFRGKTIDTPMLVLEDNGCRISGGPIILFLV